MGDERKVLEGLGACKEKTSRGGGEREKKHWSPGPVCSEDG